MVIPLYLAWAAKHLRVGGVLLADNAFLFGAITDDHPSPINPLGAKGAGEGGIIAAGGCMANAVANALQSFGAQPRQLPLSPGYIWELVQSGQKQAAE